MGDAVGVDDVIAEVEGTDGMMMLGKYLWAGHDASPTASLGDILIAVSSKKDVDERETQINLFKIIETKASPKLILYAKAVYQVTLPGWSSISLYEGSLIAS